MEKYYFHDFPLNDGKRFVVSFIGWRKEEIGFLFVGRKEIGFLRKKRTRKLNKCTVH
jgi:hypothetical protein